MKRLFWLLLAIIAVLPMQAVVVRNVKSTSKGALNLQVDSIDYRRGSLTRIYGKLYGKPHTSQRIDGAKIEGKKATDIDGVDFKRYFQWEEDGVIPVEIDFPPLHRAPTQVMIILTVKGGASVKIEEQ